MTTSTTAYTHRDRGNRRLLRGLCRGAALQTVPQPGGRIRIPGRILEARKAQTRRAQLTPAPTAFSSFCRTRFRSAIAPSARRVGHIVKTEDALRAATAVPCSPLPSSYGENGTRGAFHTSAISKPELADRKVREGRKKEFAHFEPSRPQELRPHSDPPARPQSSPPAWIGAN